MARQDPQVWHEKGQVEQVAKGGCGWLCHPVTFSGAPFCFHSDQDPEGVLVPFQSSCAKPSCKGQFFGLQTLKALGMRKLGLDICLWKPEKERSGLQRVPRAVGVF